MPSGHNSCTVTHMLLILYLNKPVISKRWTRAVLGVYGSLIVLQGALSLLQRS